MARTEGIRARVITDNPRLINNLKVSIYGMDLHLRVEDGKELHGKLAEAIGLPGVWHKPSERTPKDGENILCSHWIDGWHYFQGYYNESDRSVVYELPDDDRCPLDTVDYWMSVPTPPAK